jgi:predicted phage terminase large subunit-like protein
VVIDFGLAALVAFTLAGIIRFRRNQTQLIDQLRYFPKADHDDGPDALEMVFSLITHHTTYGPRIRKLSV